LAKTGSAFAIPGPKDRPTQAFDIWNLRKDFEGHKYWVEVGMWTSAGIALHSFTIQSKKEFNPPLGYPRPILRVPVVSLPSWMNVGKPYHNGAEGECLSGEPCYSFDKAANSSSITRTKHCCVGAIIDLINLLENDLHFKSFIYFTPDKKWGVYNNSTGEWNGLMEELTSGKADVTALLGINQARYENVGFTQPYMNLGMNILVRAKNVPSLNWGKFL
jgi:hypothetical protein